MQKNLLLFLLSIILFLGGCGKNENSKSENIGVNIHKIIAEEILQANSYTYVKAKEGNNEFWIAITKREIEKGKTYYFASGLEMKDFESKDLKRTFDKVLFVQEFSDQPISQKATMAVNSPHGSDMATGAMKAGSPHTKTSSLENTDISIKPVSDGISIAKLYSDRDSYAGKTVKIRGQVTKFNANIMGKNWAHIQDGSNDSGNYDLTVTTKDVVKVGDVVIFKGKITLKKNLGAGYFYEVIMEDAKKLE